MTRSLRARLQLWYGSILGVALATFAGLLYANAAWTMRDRVDRRLDAMLHFLEGTLRGFPPHKGKDKDFPPDDPDFPAFGKKGFPPKKGHLKDALELPSALASGSDAISFVIWRPDGSVLESLGRLRDEPAPDEDVAPETVWFSRGDERLASRRGPFETTLLASCSIGADLAELRRFGWLLAGGGAGVLAIGLIGGWFVSGRLLRPIDAIAQTASAISASRLDRRIDVDALDAELVGLGRVLNGMFARLEDEFARQSRFVADASHELRTPLAVLHSHLDLALSRPRSAEESRETLIACREASVRLRTLLDGLLTLARADAGRLEPIRTPIDLRPLLRDAAETFVDSAAQAGVTLTSRWPEEPMRVAADRGMLARVLTNLLSNALRHTPSGGTIALEGTIEGNEAVVRVADTGEGIGPEHVARIFERFYRVDSARSREAGGAGLGLAICKALVEAHQGRLTVASELGRGSVFAMRLPRVT